ncbi:MAG: hypothetical protein KDA57_09960 [Planctomycetales bacterium]|nr:hypothetical protein [Planctomycetales bacterium]
MASDRSILARVLAVVGIAAASGCMAPWSMGSRPTPASNSVSVVKDVRAGSSGERIANADSLDPSIDNSPKTQEEAMAAVLDELQQIGAIDQTAQQQLMADLREAKPEHWPLIVKQFQSALKYRQQLAARESPNTLQQSASSSLAKYSEAMRPPAPASRETNVAQLDMATIASQASQELRESEHVEISDAQPPLETTRESDSLDSAKPLPPPTTTPLKPQPTARAVPQQQVIEQATYEAPSSPAATSEDYLQSAITAMEQSAQPNPSTVDEVQQHMRLRLLHLLAGQETDAMRPIPGASGTQQDYWSNQLFAISTYLNNEDQPDVKRRAAGSLMHLDSARASLAELATLHVRNLTFVDSVDGYGVYQPREETKFRPGDQVSLYTEVENFRSESTKEGYRTYLTTSYEVLDQNNQRVDGAQFPDVEDLCRNQRRDFHVQYGVALPTRIYPGHYKLQLTITDQLSHKIGQMSVPFEIVE